MLLSGSRPVVPFAVVRSTVSFASLWEVETRGKGRFRRVDLREVIKQNAVFGVGQDCGEF